MERAVIMKVYGRVQGVGFRFYTQKAAWERHINGFVRNKPDGSVYIEAEGLDADLMSFVDWCSQGPQWARVDSMEKQFVGPFGYKGFEIR
jgi:acylphosphatase